jgi:hypothetical protein
MIRMSLCVAAMTLSACTTSLETRPAYDRSELHQALPGVEYSLPMLQYQADLSYRIDKCPERPADDSKSVVLALKATAASSYVAGESYTVDYAALSSPLKTTDFSIQTRQGTNILQSVNASAEDKTADVIKSAVELGLDVVSMVAPVPIPDLVTPQSADPLGVRTAREMIARFSRNRLGCHPDALAEMTKVSEAKDAIKKLKPVVERRTAEIEQITSRLKLRIRKAVDGPKLAEAHEELLTKSAELAAAQTKLTEAQAELAFVDSQSWPRNPFVKQGDLPIGDRFAAWASTRLVLVPTSHVDADALQLALDQKLAEKTLSERDAVDLNAFVTRAIENERKAASEAGLCGIDESLADCARREFVVTARLATAEPAPAACRGNAPEDYHSGCLTGIGAVQARTNIPHKGIFVRPPVRARLELCHKVKGCAAAGGPLYRSGWDTAPQLGQLRFIPMRNRMFQNNALTLTLREDGSIEKLQYSDKAAVAAVALGAAADTANKVEAFLDEREKERKQAITDARAEVTYQRGEIAYQRSEIAYQRTEAAAVRAEELAQIQHEIDRLNKQKAKMAAEAPPTVPESFAAETAWINAQVAQLQSRLALLKAEDELARQAAERASGAS